ncbi:hypothetical protein MPQ_2177 [Methylovorus sp. MP688]|nr:hypothetical protein MPQ_2177 [Methylovorus sp. MP688]
MGSIPAQPTNTKKGLREIVTPFFHLYRYLSSIPWPGLAIWAWQSPGLDEKSDAAGFY